jgi:2-phospho-L-lactate guanylyltransferase
MAPDADPLAVSPAALTWSLVVPVKLLAQAKSRLTGLADDSRPKIALAMAADTISAAVAAETVAAVLVVTDDPEVSDIAAEVGAIVLADAPRAGLNEALAHGAEYSGRRWPDRGRAGLAGDLPALKPRELTAALAAAARVAEAFVPDFEGTGTTLYAATPGAPFLPRFGPASRDRHLGAGAVELGTGQLTGLRRDVDTIEDLRAAARIGLGPRTLALIAAGSWV